MSIHRRLVLALPFVFALRPAMAGGTVDGEAVGRGLAEGRLLVVDVREVSEFTAGHVPGAINMPLSRFDPTALPKPADRTVVLMCRSGRRSAQALAAVVAAGRSDVLDYSGSWNDWTARGGAVVSGR